MVMIKKGLSLENQMKEAAKHDDDDMTFSLSLCRLVGSASRCSFCGTPLDRSHAIACRRLLRLATACKLGLATACFDLPPLASTCRPLCILLLLLLLSVLLRLLVFVGFVPGVTVVCLVGWWIVYVYVVVVGGGGVDHCQCGGWARHVVTSTRDD
jgi:hypothetical protein